jgi:hypothetical protein
MSVHIQQAWRFGCEMLQQLRDHRADTARRFAESPEIVRSLIEEQDKQIAKIENEQQRVREYARRAGIDLDAPS